MRTRFIGAVALATTIFGASAADSDFLRNWADQALASGCSSDGVCLTLIVTKSKDFDGLLQGSVTIFASAPGSTPSFWRVQCSGPAFAGVLFLNSGTGATNISATLDPLAPGCESTNVSGPVVVNLDSYFDGNIRSIQDGKFYSDQRGVITRTNFRIDRFSSVFSGTVADRTFVIFGSARAERNERISQEIVPQGTN